jgi:hypothetical protein
MARSWMTARFLAQPAADVASLAGRATKAHQAPNGATWRATEATLAGMEGLPVPSEPGISICVDLSATPFYLKGSGHPDD